MKVAVGVAAVRPLWWLGRKVKRWVASRAGSAQSWVARMNPGWYAVMPQELLPPDRLAERTQASVAVMLAKGPGGWSVRGLTAEDAVDLMLGVTYRELEMDVSLFEYAAAGIISPNSHLTLADRVVSSFAHQVRHLQVRIPEGCSPLEVQEGLVRVLEDLR